MAVYFRQRHKARSIGSDFMSARDDYATAVSPPQCSHKLGSLKRPMMSQVQALSGEPEKRKDHEYVVFFFFQRCVPQTERDVYCVRDVSFGSEVCLRHVIWNTSLHCEQSEQHYYAKHDITWRSQTSLKSPNYGKISQDCTECDLFFFNEAAYWKSDRATAQ